jgi:hypothetical protein
MKIKLLIFLLAPIFLLFLLVLVTILTPIIIGVMTLYFIVKGVFKKDEDKFQPATDGIFDAYRSYFENQLQKQNGLSESHELKMVAEAVLEGSFHLFDYKELPELPYSSEEIANCLKEYINSTRKNENRMGDDFSQDDIVVTLGLSYLYKPKEQYQQAMYDKYVLKQF